MSENEHTADFPTWLNIGTADAEVLAEKNEQYGGSWKRRGGVGAFMMAARKWDRIEEIVRTKYGYDIFKAIREERGNSTETMLETIRDLRRYFTLIEAEMLREFQAEAEARKSTVVKPAPSLIGTPTPYVTRDARHVGEPIQVQLEGSVHIGDRNTDPKVMGRIDVPPEVASIYSPHQPGAHGETDQDAIANRQAHLDYQPDRRVPRFDVPDSAHGFTKELDAQPE